MSPTKPFPFKQNRVLFSTIATCLLVAFFANVARPAANRDSAKSTTGSSPKLILNRKPKGEEGARIEVSGLSAKRLKSLVAAKLNTEKWNDLLPVRVFEKTVKTNTTRPAMLGSYRVEGDRIVFRPRFPFRPGLKYRAVLRIGESRPVELVFALPKPPPTPLARVTHVFPSRNTLPENLLKFYIHFSAPMSRGKSYTRVKLVNAKGKTVEHPFLELGEELWDHSGTRFTLYFDPGRIKRGLKPREIFGPALETGKSYTLVIDRRWNDPKGRPLKASFRKAFKVGKPDDKQPDPKTWKVSSPGAASREPLVLRFPEPLDHALLQRLLIVKDANGREIAGTVAVDKQETRWRFTPTRKWPAGAKSLEITTTLEDLAGNSIGRAFEVDVVRPIRRSIVAKTVTLPFRVVPGERKSR